MSGRKRTKMKKTIAKLLVGVLVIGSIVSVVACAKQNSSELNVAVGAQFNTFDPALNSEVWNAYVTTHMFSGMFRKGAEDEIINELCESYEVSEDGLTYTFHMVDDARWSDGEPVTAYDFEYSYLRALSYGADNEFTLALTEMFNIAGAMDYHEAALQEGESFDCTTADHSYV